MSDSWCAPDVLVVLVRGGSAGTLHIVNISLDESMPSMEPSAVLLDGSSPRLLLRHTFDSSSQDIVGHMLYRPDLRRAIYMLLQHILSIRLTNANALRLCSHSGIAIQTITRSGVTMIRWLPCALGRDIEGITLLVELLPSLFSKAAPL